MTDEETRPYPLRYRATGELVTPRKEPRVEGEEPFGWELQLDLHGCNPYVIRTGTVLSAYADELVKLIDMKAYGLPLLDRFGLASPKTAGYTLVQRIETSLISGHFSEARNSAHLNVFSCKPFDAMTVHDFSVEFFGADRAVMVMTERW
jgi:hypothetical protein